MTDFLKHYTPMENGEEMEIRVGYAKGGMNMFTYKQEPRGLYIYFQPVTRSTSSGGFATHSFQMFDKRGRKMLVKEMGRKAPKQCQKLADKIEADVDTLAALAITQEWGKLHLRLENVRV